MPTPDNSGHTLRGARVVFESGNETTAIVVRDATKPIDGATCIAVDDAVADHGCVEDDTDGGFGRRPDGDADSRGESVRDFEHLAASAGRALRRLPNLPARCGRGG